MPSAVLPTPGWSSGGRVAAQPHVLGAERGGRADDRADVERLGHRVEQQREPRVAGPPPVAVEPLDVGRAQLPGRARRRRARAGSRAGHLGSFGREYPPGADGNRSVRRAASRTSPVRPASGAASRRRGCGPSPGSAPEAAGRPGASRASQSPSRACSASLPIRTGGLDQIPANRGGRDGSSGAAQRTLPRPAARAFRAHRLEGPLVDVDRPDRGARRARGQHAGDRAVAAAQVEQVAGRRRRRGLLEQQAGARVEPAGGEHPGVGGELQVDVGQHHADQAGAVRGLRLRREVVLGQTALSAPARPAAAWPASAGLMNRRVTHRSTMNVMIGIGAGQQQDDGRLGRQLELRDSIQAQTR